MFYNVFFTAYPDTFGGNGNNMKCKLPFTYNGTSYSTCILREDGSGLWCPTTHNYETDGLWGYCVGE